MKVQIFENFVSDEECKVLTNWIIDNKDKDFFTPVEMGGNRVSTRFTFDTDWNYPKEAYEIKNRLIKHLDIKKKFHPPFKDGIVASCAFPGDFVYEHVDPEWFEGYATVHCNVVVSEPDFGGIAVIGGEEYVMKRGNILCYPVSEVAHEITKIEGSKLRLMWVFGFCVAK